MEFIEDKDVFLVKLPNKLKAFLKDPQTFSLSNQDDIIGLVEEDINKESNSELLNPERKHYRPAFQAKMKLNVQVKR